MNFIAGNNFLSHIRDKKMIIISQILHILRPAIKESDSLKPLSQFLEIPMLQPVPVAASLLAATVAAAIAQLTAPRSSAPF